MEATLLSPFCVTITLNTVVAEVLSQFADKLEKSKDVTATVKEIVQANIRGNIAAAAAEKA